MVPAGVAPWKEGLLKALSKNKGLANAKYVQIATVRPDGRPSNRTVVFRGFLRQITNDLTFITDRRAKKVAEIAANPWAEVCWYFPNSREQYRLGGSLTIVDETCADEVLAKARRDTWHNISATGREQFSWPDPGLPRNQDRSEYDISMTEEESAIAAKEFCLMVLKVTEVDYLLLKGNTRHVFDIISGPEGTLEWQETDVNP
ncbi:MAG: hypothetical protein WDW38_011083 [Sanguina aurantia]